jgi:SLOG cluster3 family
MSVTTTTCLKGLPVMLSASLPDDLVGTSRAQDLYDLLVVLAGGILSSGGRLVFGGHPSVTPLLHRVAKGAGVREGQVTLFQLERFREQAPAEVQDRSVFGEVRWCEDLESMRECMAVIADAGVFVGGKTAGYVGNKPGIRDEFERFVKRHPLGPVYLLGLLDGETRLLIEEKSGEQPWGPRYLSSEERELLRFASSPDLAAGLVLADLAHMVEAGCR